VTVDHLCLNGGVCVNKHNTHSCSCQVGWTGSYCEIGIDECLSNPCRNGGTCVDYQGGYDCQ
ncbi:neurogenic locus notch protein 2-like, partial [Clarias magur]